MNPNTADFLDRIPHKYVTYPAFKDTYSSVYYAQAVCHIAARVANSMLYVFFDEQEWVHEHLGLEAPTIYIAHNQDKIVLKICSL